MSSPAACADGSSDWRTLFRGGWILWIWVAIFFASLLLIPQIVEDVLNVPEFRGVGVFLYRHIHRDVIEGISAAAGLLATFAFTCLTWSYSPFWSLAAQFSSIMLCGPFAARGLYVWLQCDALFTPNARCPWPTFEAYVDDPWQMFAMFIAPGVGVVYFGWGTWRLIKRQGRSSDLE